MREKLFNCHYIRWRIFVGQEVYLFFSFFLFRYKFYQVRYYCLKFQPHKILYSLSANRTIEPFYLTTFFARFLFANVSHATHTHTHILSNPFLISCVPLNEHNLLPQQTFRQLLALHRPANYAREIYNNNNKNNSFTHFRCWPLTPPGHFHKHAQALSHIYKFVTGTHWLWE